MTGWTYDTLVAALQTWTEDDSTEFQAAIPDIIVLGETRCIRDLNLTFFDEVVTTAMTAGQFTLSKPENTIAVQAVYYLISTGTLRYLDQLSYEWARWLAPRQAQTGIPKAWWDLDEDSVGIAPTPDQSYTAQMKVTRRPTNLSSSNQTTWLGTNMADLLFYACIWESERYLKFDSNDFNRMKSYQEDYTTRILPAARLEVAKQQKIKFETPREVPDVGGVQ